MSDISSDSEDDCYDKIPQKLKQLKNKFALNNLLRGEADSKDDKEIAYDENFGNKEDSDVIQVLDSSIDLTNLTPIELDSSSVGVCTRSRRSKRKNSDIQLSPVTPTQKSTKRGRGRGKGRSSQTSKPSAPKPAGRGRRRGKSRHNDISRDSMTIAVSTSPTRRGRRRTRHEITQDSESIITYSVGNTDEYPDLSDNQALFSNKNIDTAKLDSVIDLDVSLDNEVLSVKVYWQHSEVFKFNIRRLQKLTQIFDFFVNKEGVSRDRLLFTYNYKRTNKILHPEDTPDSIDYNIAKFIEGGIVNKQFSLNPSHTPQNKGFVLKFQCQNRKKPFELSVVKDEKLQIAMVKYAEHLEIPIAKLIFKFDGETVQGNSTPNDLDMDSGDCIDVKII